MAAPKPTPIPTIVVHNIVHNVLHGPLSIATLIAAIAALITALVACIGLYVGGRRARSALHLESERAQEEAERARLTIGINNLWKLIEQWDSPDMRLRRARLAQTLLGQKGIPQSVPDLAIDVLNTFELLGYLVRAEVLGLEDAWVNFSSWINSWWFVFEAAIHKIQLDDSTIYEDYSRLVERFLDFEAGRQNLDRRELIPRRVDLTGFLEGEAGLLDRIEIQETKSTPGRRGKQGARGRG